MNADKCQANKKIALSTAASILIFLYYSEIILMTEVTIVFVREKVKRL